MTYNKYNNFRTSGGRLDSKLERYAYNTLCVLEKQSFIFNLKKMVKHVDTIVLSESFKVKSSKTMTGKSKIRHITYTPDFWFKTQKNTVLPNGVLIEAGKKCYLEVKSRATKKIRDYFMRKHLMLKHCVENDLVFIEVIDNIEWIAYNN